MAQAERTERAQHGPYELRALLIGDMFISRKEGNRPRATVATVETVEQWDRFVAALDAGADEVAAVHAIDAVDDVVGFPDCETSPGGCPDCGTALSSDWTCPACGAEWDELSEDDDGGES